jgi:hypothetical protein
MPQHDDGQDDVSALAFFNPSQSGSDDRGRAERQALIFSSGDDDSGQESAVGALTGQAVTQSEDTKTEVDALLSATDVVTDDAQEDEEDGYSVKVTNPAGTVSVTAFPDGSIQQIDFSAKVASKTEAALAEEILVIADLARQKGLASQQALMVEAMQATGLDDDNTARDLIMESLDLPTPQQAEAAQAEVFATRYATSTD